MGIMFLLIKTLWAGISQDDTDSTSLILFSRYNDNTMGGVGDAGVNFIAGSLRKKDTWYHVSVNYTGDNVDTYINGVNLSPNAQLLNWFTGDEGHNKSMGADDDNTLGTTFGGNFRNK